MAERSHHCKICRNTRCLQIEAALAAGMRFMEIERKFRGVTRYSLRRHLLHQQRDQTPPTTQQSVEQIKDDDLLTKCHRIQAGLDVIQREFERTGDPRGKLNVLKVKGTVLDLETRIRTRHSEGGGTTINFGVFGSLPGETVQAYQRRVYQTAEEKLLAPQVDVDNYRTYQHALKKLGIDDELTAKILDLFGYALPVAPVIFPGPPAALPAPQQEASPNA